MYQDNTLQRIDRDCGGGSFRSCFSPLTSYARERSDDMKHVANGIKATVALKKGPLSDDKRRTSTLNCNYEPKYSPVSTRSVS